MAQYFITVLRNCVILFSLVLDYSRCLFLVGCFFRGGYRFGLIVEVGRGCLAIVLLDLCFSLLIIILGVFSDALG